MNAKKVAPKLDAKHVEAIKALTTVAAQIRYTHANVTKSTGDISRILTEVLERNVRYQWVRNVLNQPLKNS